MFLELSTLCMSSFSLIAMNTSMNIGVLCMRRPRFFRYFVYTQFVCCNLSELDLDSVIDLYRVFAFFYR